MYIGKFKNARVAEEGDAKFWIVEDDKGRDYHTLRNERKTKYVLITQAEPPYVVAGVNEIGLFSFSNPHHVYFLDSYPNDINKVIYTYTDKDGFLPYVDVESWRYNQNLRIKNEIFDRTMKQLPIDDLQARYKVVNEYKGDGITTPLP